MNSYKIASASKRMLAIGLGAEDFRTDMGMQRSESAEEILFARNLIALHAHAANIKAMDYVYSNFKNEEGFRADTLLGKKLGYTGKSVVHPSQVSIVHEIYTPSEEEIDNAKAIFAAYEDALKCGSGVTSLNGKMIDSRWLQERWQFYLLPKPPVWRFKYGYKINGRNKKDTGI